MDSFEINKIVASILLIALLFIGIGKISDLIFHVDKPETDGYKVELPESTTTGEISETKIGTIENVDIASLIHSFKKTNSHSFFLTVTSS